MQKLRSSPVAHGHRCYSYSFPPTPKHNEHFGLRTHHLWPQGEVTVTVTELVKQNKETWHKGNGMLNCLGHAFFTSLSWFQSLRFWSQLLTNLIIRLSFVTSFSVSYLTQAHTLAVNSPQITTTRLIYEVLEFPFSRYIFVYIFYIFSLSFPNPNRQG